MTREDHQEWLPTGGATSTGGSGSRYRRFLEESKGCPIRVADALDDLTDRILGRLEDPRTARPWDRRGLVVGQVQSGKTGNYIGLICKAADAGYKLIVVLAGVHNSLRSQTQLRLDQGLPRLRHPAGASLDQTDNVGSGVGQLAGVERLRAVHSADQQRGDAATSTSRVARQVGVDIGGNDPVVLVVKKNVSILRNLIDWVHDAPPAASTPRLGPDRRPGCRCW